MDRRAFLKTATVAAAILAKTKDAAMTGKVELFKTSSHYDGTIKNPSWLGYTNG